MRIDLDKLDSGNIREEIIFQLGICDKIEDFSREELGQKADIILKVIGNRIDEIERINTPQNCNNISVRERQNIQYYRLALDKCKGNVKEMKCSNCGNDVKIVFRDMQGEPELCGICYLRLSKEEEK